MIVLFYSEECQICQKILNYINTNLNENKISYFKFIDVKKIHIDNIKVIPTIIDEDMKVPIEGIKVFEYIINQKYFNHPTNNIDFWLDKDVPTPNIDQDTKAIERHNLSYANFNENIKNINENIKNINNIEKQKSTYIIKDRKNLALLKLKK
jgi:hypothetical protein